MGSADRGVTPGIVERQFMEPLRAASERTLHRERISQDELERRENIVGWLNKLSARDRAVEALSSMRAARPLKPPGR